MRNILFRLWAYLFGRPCFTRFNYLLFHLSLRGLGVLNYYNVKESGEYSAIKKILKHHPSPVVFDIGANEGHYTKLILDCAKNARIFCLEANPKTAARLQNNFKNHSQITVIPKAVSNTTEEATLYDYSDSDGSSHATLLSGALEAIHHQTTKALSVVCTTVDELIKKHQIQSIDLLKIDVEGYELKVLQGASEALKTGKIDTIQFEITESNVLHKLILQDFIKLLEPRYDLFRILPHGLLSINPYSALKHELFGYQNLLAIKRH